MKNILGRIKNQAYYGFLLLRYVGFGAFFQMVWHQVYNKNVHLGYKKPLSDLVRPEHKTDIKYYFRKATEQDMADVFKKVKGESKKSAEFLLERKWLFDCGLRSWYIARIADTDDPCFIQAVITSEDNEAMARNFKGWFPKLKDDEILLEGAYAFEKYRGGGLCHEIATEIWESYREKGYKNMITFIKKDNIASQKAAAKTGYELFEEVPVKKILFMTFRNFNNKPRAVVEEASREEAASRA